MKNIGGINYQDELKTTNASGALGSLFSNPNGQQIFVPQAQASNTFAPPPKEIAVSSPTQAVDQTMKNINTLNTIGQAYQTGQGNTAVTLDPKTGQPFVAGSANQQGEQPQSQGLTEDELTAIGAVKTPEQKEADTLRKQSIEFQDQYNVLASQLDSISTRDYSSNALIQNIKQKYDARRKEMERSGKSTVGRLQQVGFRSGAQRYSGGAFDTLISAQEQANIDRLSELDAEESSLILQATQALRNEDYGLLDKKMSAIEKARTNKETAYQDLIKSMAAEDKARADKAKEEREQEKFEFETATKKAEAFAPYLAQFLSEDLDANTKLFEQVRNAHPEYQNPDAMNALLGATQKEYEAQNKEQTNSDILSYNLYAKQTKEAGGQPITYNEWLTQDANRKAKAAASANGLTNYQSVQVFNSIVDKYNKSPLIAAADRVGNLASTVEQIKKTPTNGATQLSLIYGIIQALDNYQSAVREGEIALSQQIQSKVGKMENYFQQINNGQILSKDAALDMANESQRIIDSIRNSAQIKARSFEAQAKTAGIGDQWQQYIKNAQPAYQQGGQQGNSFSVEGKTYNVGDTVTNKQGQKGRVNQDGTITPIQ